MALNLGGGAKERLGWKTKQKSLAGISRASLDMATSRGAVYQRRYRERINETNKTNAEFMQYAVEQSPELVQRFFEEKAVILTKFYNLLNCVKNSNIFKPVTETSESSRSRRYGNDPPRKPGN